jgi:hypothetical protein
MPLKKYGVLKGSATARRLGSGPSPHYQVRLIDETADHRISVNVSSKLAPSELEYLWPDISTPGGSPNASREGGLQAGTYNECVDISGPIATIAARNSCDHRPTPRRGWLKFLHAPCLTETRTVSAGTMAPTAGTRAWGRLYLGSRSPVGACLKGLPDSGRWAGRRSTVVDAT